MTLTPVHKACKEKGDMVIVATDIIVQGRSAINSALMSIQKYRDCTLERTCKANAEGENSSFIFGVCVKSVPRYHFKLSCVVLQMAIKEFFETNL